MKELTLYDKKNIQRLRDKIKELESIETAEEFNAWQGRIEIVLLSFLKKKYEYIVDEICSIEAMGGYTAIPRVQAAKKEAKQLLETVIELVETNALKPPKQNEVVKNSFSNEPKEKQMTVERAIEIVNVAKESLKAVNTHDQFKSWQINAASTLAKLKVDKLTITSLTDIKSFLNYGIGTLDKISEAKESCSTILDGVIDNFRHFGIEEEIVTEAKSKSDSLPGIVINNNNNNTNNNANHNSQSTDITQVVSQSISVTVEVQLKAIFESFTDELTTKQIRELNQIQASNLPPEEKKKSILSILGDKVLDFGVAVLANPEIWKMFT